MMQTSSVSSREVHTSLAETANAAWLGPDICMSQAGSANMMGAWPHQESFGGKHLKHSSVPGQKHRKINSDVFPQFF